MGKQGQSQQRQEHLVDGQPVGAGHAPAAPRGYDDHTHGGTAAGVRVRRSEALGHG